MKENVILVNCSVFVILIPPAQISVKKFNIYVESPKNLMVITKLKYLLLLKATSKIENF